MEHAIVESRPEIFAMWVEPIMDVVFRSDLGFDTISLAEMITMQTTEVGGTNDVAMIRGE